MPENISTNQKLSTSKDETPLVRRYNEVLVNELATAEEKLKAEELLEHYSNFDLRKKMLEKDINWQKDNMEYDLRTNNYILEKVRNSDTYAQNLYAAMCNNDFIKNDVWPILTDKTWSCSWRSSGGIIADMRGHGDYLDYYCSGIFDEGQHRSGEVEEGIVTDEVRKDLLKLGWIVKNGNNHE